MNAVENNVVPKNLMVEITATRQNRLADPLGIHLNPEGSKWEVDSLTGLLAVRIIALGNKVDSLLAQELFREARLIMVDIQDLAGVIRDLQIWPFINGEQYSFTYGHVIYHVNALSPRKFEELERAKDHYIKSADRIKLTGKFNTEKDS